MSKTGERKRDFAQRAVVGILLLGCLGIALFHGIRASGGLQWSPSIDVFRDTAWAQTFADGGWFEDAFYAGETLSYVPLVPAMVAMLSFATGAPVHAVYAQAGAYLNLLVPLALFLLAARWYGRWAAIATVVAFFFLFNSDLDIAVTYSPLLLTSGFAQALFFLSLVAYGASLANGSWKRDALVGIGLGLVFMTHVGPAVILGGIVLLCEGSRALRTGQWKQGWVRIGSILGVALVAGAPLSASILGHYRLRVLNPEPSQWIWPPEAAEVPALVFENLSLLIPFTLIGLVVALRGWSRKPEASIIAAWIVTAGSLWLWGFVCLAAQRRGFKIPSAPVPTWHFLWYLKTLEPLLFGVGLVAVCRRLAAKIPERIMPGSWRVGALTSTAAIILAAVAYPGFGQNFATDRADAEYFSSIVPRTEIISWIREHTTLQDVFLTHSAEAWAPILIVGPAGRRVVATNTSMFASPFVDWKERKRDQRTMVRALTTGDVEGFKRLATHYGVTFLLASEERWKNRENRAADLRGQRLIIHPAFAEIVGQEFEARARYEDESVRIYRVEW